MTGHPAWLGDDRLVRVAWSRLAEPGDRAAAAARGLLGPSTALGHVLSDRPLPLAVARRTDETDGSADGSADGDTNGAVAGPDPPRATRRALDEALERWRVRVAELDPERDLERMHRLGGRVVVPGDAEWPAGMQDLGAAAPVCLWVRGAAATGGLAGMVARSVAVVGSRACTAYGEHVAGVIAAGVAERGFAVVSGAAFGIDAVAHRATLAVGGRTVAFLACGVDRVYPTAHANLLRTITEEGLVVSESPLGGAPTRWRFLERNRLIAAAATATVVVEAAWRSGALSTATRAAGLGRPLGAVPGPVTSAASAGCHRLIRDLAATCVTDAQEVAELAGRIGELDLRPPAVAARPHDELDGDDLRVWEALPVGAGRPPASIASVAGLPPRQVLGALGRLSLRGLADAVPTADGSQAWRRGRPPATDRLRPSDPDRA